MSVGRGNLGGNEGVAATQEGTATKLDHLKELSDDHPISWSVNSMMPSTMVC